MLLAWHETPKGLHPNPNVPRRWRKNCPDASQIIQDSISPSIMRDNKRVNLVPLCLLTMIQFGGKASRFPSTLRKRDILFLVEGSRCIVMDVAETSYTWMAFYSTSSRSLDCFFNGCDGHVFTSLVVHV